jgi:HAD superfamily hydrolase (TIGR01490 family)
VQHLGLEYATHVLPSTVRPRALEQIDWHQRQGDDVVVVSGSLSVYVRPWCEAIGIRCIATELDECNGRLTGRYRHGECTGMEKARRISSQFDLSRYSQVYAYGDTSEDLEMLALAHRKYYRWKEISAPLDTAGAVRGSDVGRDAAAI